MAAELGIRLTKKCVLLAKAESTVGTDSSPSVGSDALVVEAPDFKIDPSLLVRNNVADDLSPFAPIIGRKLASMTFTHEIRSNGLHTGSTSDAPKLGRLIEACGFAPTGLTTTGRIQTPILDSSNSVSAPAVTWAKGGTLTLTQPVVYRVVVTTGGASGTAAVDLYSNRNDSVGGTEDANYRISTATVLTSGTTALSLGTSGATITPTWTGNLVLNDVYYVLVTGAGIKYKPISTGQPTLTLYMYLDGVLHKMTAARGNMQITAEAGNYAKAVFTFQGLYISAIDSTPGTPTLETTLPQQVELSNLIWGTQRDLVAAKWTFDLKNTLTPRPDVNAKDGYKGTRITARDPEGSFDPEATLEADHPFWADIEAGATQHFFAQVGTTQGNIIAIRAPRVQISALPYGDRSGIRTYDVGFKFTRLSGDDEVEFYAL